MPKHKRTFVVAAFAVEDWTQEDADRLATRYADALTTLLPQDARVSTAATFEAAVDEINEDW